MIDEKTEPYYSIHTRMGAITTPLNTTIPLLHVYSNPQEQMEPGIQEAHWLGLVQTEGRVRIIFEAECVSVYTRMRDPITRASEWIQMFQHDVPAGSSDQKLKDELKVRFCKHGMFALIFDCLNLPVSLMLMLEHVEDTKDEFFITGTRCLPLIGDELNPLQSFNFTELLRKAKA